VFTALALLGLARSGADTDTGGLFRKGVFTMLSAHTGTGFGVNRGPVPSWVVRARMRAGDGGVQVGDQVRAACVPMTAAIVVGIAAGGEVRLSLLDAGPEKLPAAVRSC